MRGVGMGIRVWRRKNKRKKKEKKRKRKRNIWMQGKKGIIIFKKITIKCYYNIFTINFK